jgi:hypothetical protein
MSERAPRKSSHRIDGSRLQLVGESDESQQDRFLGEPLAVLFPINWPAPLGDVAGFEVAPGVFAGW